MTRLWKQISADEAKQHHLYGLRGWLALFAFGVFAGFLQLFGAISGEALKIGVTVNQFLSYPVPGVLFMKAALAIGLLKVIVIYALLFSKHPKFRPATSYVLVGELPALLLVGILIGGTPGLGQFLIFTLPSWLISCAVWVTYLQRSKRVRVTFEHAIEVAKDKTADIPKVPETSAIDATYEKIDQELATDNLDRAIWTRALGDAEGDADRAKGLYIKYRAQRILAANQNESGHQTTFDAFNVEKTAKKYHFRFVAATAAILVSAVAAVIVIGFFTEKPAPTKSATSGSNLDLASFADMDPVEKKPVKGDPFNPTEQEKALNQEIPDWRSIVGVTGDKTNKYRRWLSKQPPEYQDELNSTNSAAVIARSIAKFKAETK